MTPVLDRQLPTFFCELKPRSRFPVFQKKSWTTFEIDFFGRKKVVFWRSLFSPKLWGHFSRPKRKFIVSELCILCAYSASCCTAKLEGQLVEEVCEVMWWQVFGWFFETCLVLQKLKPDLRHLLGVCALGQLIGAEHDGLGHFLQWCDVCRDIRGDMFVTLFFYVHCDSRPPSLVMTTHMGMSGDLDNLYAPGNRQGFGGNLGEIWPKIWKWFLSQTHLSPHFPLITPAPMITLPNAPRGNDRALPFSISELNKLIWQRTERSEICKNAAKHKSGHHVDRVPSVTPFTWFHQCSPGETPEVTPPTHSGKFIDPMLQVWGGFMGGYMENGGWLEGKCKVPKH